MSWNHIVPEIEPGTKYLFNQKGYFLELNARGHIRTSNKCFAIKGYFNLPSLFFFCFVQIFLFKPYHFSLHLTCLWWEKYRNWSKKNQFTKLVYFILKSTIAKAQYLCRISLGNQSFAQLQFLHKTKFKHYKHICPYEDVHFNLVCKN